MLGTCRVKSRFYFCVDYLLTPSNDDTKKADSCLALRNREFENFSECDTDSVTYIVSMADSEKALTGNIHKRISSKMTDPCEPALLIL